MPTWGDLNPFNWGKKSVKDLRKDVDPNATSLGREGDRDRQRLDYMLDQVQNREAPQAGEAAMTQAAMAHGSNANAAQIDQAQQAQFRAQQMALANRLAGVATGQQAGAGELAVQRQANRAVAQQQAMARMGRGSNAALAARLAATNTANIGTDAAGQSQMAALQDQQAANAQLANVLSGGRGADIGLATSQAGFQQQAGLANQQNALQVALANQGSQNQANLANQSAQNQFSLANLQSQLQTMGMNDQAQLGIMSQLTGLSMAELQARLEMEKQIQANAAGQQGVFGDLLAAGGQIGAAAMMKAGQKGGG